MTVEEVAAEVLFSATKLSRLENATRPANPRDVRELCRVYGVADPAGLMDLAELSREPGWWSRFDDLGQRIEPLIGLEQVAVAITSYSMYYVPPLLQTEDYARAVIRGISRRMDPRVVNERVEARMLRQRRFDGVGRPRYRALADEAVLRRELGGSAVMRGQLDKILTFVTDDLGSVQIIPFGAGAHASADSNFDLLEFGEDTRQAPVVYVEGLVGNHILERPAELARYREAIEYLREIALSTQDSADMISEVRDSYSN